MTHHDFSSPLSATLEVIARIGYGARGFVYLSIGTLALLTALALRQAPSGSNGAIAALSHWPLGWVWIAAVSLGLAGFALWRLLQALLDADRHGRSRKALLARGGQAISALIYGGLAWSTVGLLMRLRQITPREEEASAHAGAAQVLAWPYGGWVLVVAGLFIVGGGVASIIRAARADFGRRLAGSGGTRLWACRLGRVGYAGRGVAFLPLGFFLCRAGIRLDPHDARNLGGALEWLRDQAFGTWILGLIALGLAAFGAYGLIEARFRRIDVQVG